MRSSEEMMLQEIRKKRDEKARQKMKHQKFYKKTLRMPLQKTQKERNEPTHYQEFNLRTMKRKYNIDKKTLLSPSAKKSSKTTQPVPFVFSERLSTTVQSKKDDFVSLKNKVESFFTEETYSVQRSSTKKNKKRSFFER